MTKPETFEAYYEKNPRTQIPEGMQAFKAYAVKRYKGLAQGDGAVINWTHNIEADEVEDEVERYLGESMEALLLYKEFLEKRK